MQSAVSYGIANLEDCLGVELFDRTKRSPVLNDSGKVLLQRAKNILLQIDQLHNQAQSIQMGLESHLSVGVDVFFPQKYLIQLCKGIQNKPIPIHHWRFILKALGLFLRIRHQKTMSHRPCWTFISRQHTRADLSFG